MFNIFILNQQCEQKTNLTALLPWPNYFLINSSQFLYVTQALTVFTTCMPARKAVNLECFIFCRR